VRRNSRAAWSLVLGALSALILPVAVGITHYSAVYDLIQTGFVIPVALVLAIAAVVLARRARALDLQTLGRAGGAWAARGGRLLGIVGLCEVAAGTIAFAVYGALIYAQ